MNAARDPAQPLLDFASALGDDLPDFAAHERLTEIRFYAEDFAPSPLADLDFETVAAMKKAYGGALQLRVSLGALPLLDLQNDFSGATFRRFQDSLDRSTPVVLDLVLDKTAYAARLLGDVPHNCHPLLYFFPDRLHTYLTSATLADLESDLWPDPLAKALLLVPGYDVWVDGPLLAIVGGQPSRRWQEALPKPGDAGAAARLAGIYADAFHLLRWEERWLKHLTPYHLRIQAKAEAEARAHELLLHPLQIHLANAILLYTAERTVKKNGQFVSSYATTRTVVNLAHEPADAPLRNDILATGVEGLWNILEWAYDSTWSLGERQPLVQIAMVDALRAVQADRRYRLLLENAPRIYDNLEWNWRELLEDKVDTYLDQVQQVEKHVSDAVTSHSEQVTQLVKGVSETMLAAVGVTLASFVAALFGDNFDVTVFRIGVWAYVIYVFFFPLLYSLSNQLGRYRALERQFRYRRRRFDQRLHPEWVDEIVGDEVEASRRRFWFWFRVTVTVYFLVLAAAVVAAFEIPARFAPPATP